MPTYRITSPDGKQFDVTAPEGASQDQVLEYAKSQWTKPAESPKQAPNPTEGNSAFTNAAAGVGKAVYDTGRGIKQRLDEAAAGLESMVPGAAAINRFFGTKSAAQIKAQGQQDVAEAKALDKPLMNTTAGTFGNILGGAAMAAPMAAMGPVGAGVVSGFLQPTTNGPAETAQNMVLGGGAGYVGNKLVGGLSRIARPNVSPEVQALMKEGITPTPGQIMGGAWNKAEEKAMSLPLMGDSIAASRNRAVGELNNAVANRALAPIGEKLPAGKTGREAVEYVDDVLGKAYDRLLPKMSAQADGGFVQGVGNLQQMVNTGAVDPKYAAHFNKFLQSNVLGKFQGQNAVTGQTIKQIEGDIGSEAKRFAISQDADQRLIGDALQELQAQFRGMVQRSNPQYADELKAINTGWANFKRMQRAAGAVGAEDGVFSPAQLQNAVKALDRSKDKARFAEGNALMQDLSDTAKSVMGSKVPDSGTAGRLMNVGALTSGVYNPAIPASLLAGKAVYSAPAQKAIAALLTQRPKSAGLLADYLEAAAPAGGLLGIGTGLALQ